MMTRTLISGLFNELHPATVSVVWCRAYAPEEYPPLLHDLRHSHSINVFFPSRKLMAQVRARGLEAGRGQPPNRARPACRAPRGAP